MILFALISNLLRYVADLEEGSAELIKERHLRAGHNAPGSAHPASMFNDLVFGMSKTRLESGNVCSLAICPSQIDYWCTGSGLCRINLMGPKEKPSLWALEATSQPEPGPELV